MEKLISLCMIVKDEEKVLRRCLESVKTLVDEIIIVDTGSLDQSKSIAREYTDKVYDFTWINDFSAAKNEAIRKATSKWILVLDADEYVQPNEHEELRKFLSQYDWSENCAFNLPIMNLVGETDQAAEKIVESSAVRLFPNRQEYHYTRPIHEQLTHAAEPIKFISYSFLIFHTGYTSEARQRKDKSNRNLDIFKNLEENGNPLDPYYCFTLANEYQNIRDHKKALYYYQRAYNQSGPNDSWFAFCVNRMLNTLFQLDRLKEAFDLIEKSVSWWPHYADFHCFQGSVYQQFGLYDAAAEKFLECIRIADEAEKTNRPYWLVSPEYGRALPYQRLAQIYHSQFNLPQMVHYLTKSVQTNLQDYKSLYQLMTLLSRSEETQSILSLAEKLYPSEQAKNVVLLFQTFNMIGHRELANLYYDRSKLLGIQHLPMDLLRYSLLNGDQEAFEAYLRSVDDAISNDTSDLLKLLAAAYLLWGNETVLDRIDDPIKQALISLQNSPHNNNEELENPEFFYSLAVDLFNMQYYEEFDQLVNKLHDSKLIHSIADYFFTQHQVELALDYYSILLNNGQLLAQGFENLASLYLNQGIVDEGLEFLQKAIELNPSKYPLTCMYCLHATDPDQKKRYKQKLADTFPQYKALPFIQKL